MCIYIYIYMCIRSRACLREAAAPPPRAGARTLLCSTDSRERTWIHGCSGISRCDYQAGSRTTPSPTPWTDVLMYH